MYAYITFHHWTTSFRTGHESRRRKALGREEEARGGKETKGSWGEETERHRGEETALGGGWEEETSHDVSTEGQSMRFLTFSWLWVTCSFPLVELTGKGLKPETCF